MFAVTTFTGPRGTEGEVAHGRAIADAAHDAQVPRLAYTSVGAADRATGILQFESKGQIEQYLHEVGVPTIVIRPTFFMDNFLNLFIPTIEDEPGRGPCATHTWGAVADDRCGGHRKSRRHRPA